MNDEEIDGIIYEEGLSSVWTQIHGLYKLIELLLKQINKIKAGSWSNGKIYQKILGTGYTMKFDLYTTLPCNNSMEYFLANTLTGFTTHLTRKMRSRGE